MDKKKFHFVGVGGIGMSGIALILLKMGYKVSGSELEPNALTEKLELLGAKVYKGHKASNIAGDVDVVVYSSSIAKDNPEYAEALKRKLPVAHRAKILGELVNTKKGIAVSGTHGKTTTTSLISVMLERSGLDPTAIIGGEIELFKSNAKYGNGPYVVAEADESDGSFVNLKPLYSVITNVEMEHMDYYRSIKDMIAAYRSFANNTKAGGAVFYNFADENAKKALKGFKGRVESFGLSREAAIYPLGIMMEGFCTSYTCVYKGHALGKVELSIPGRHNVLNSLVTVLIGLNLGIEFGQIVKSIKDFRGTKRRFQLRAESDGVMLIDDYAHHPTEIRAVLDACRGWKDKRIIVVFQPHRYSRTLHLAEEFGKCFSGADKLILTDIYPASEKPIKGVSVHTIYERVKKSGLLDIVVMEKEMIAEYVMGLKQPGDMILVMGAGNIKKVADDLAARLS